MRINSLLYCSQDDMTNQKEYPASGSQQTGVVQARKSYALMYDDNEDMDRFSYVGKVVPVLKRFFREHNFSISHNLMHCFCFVFISPLLPFASSFVFAVLRALFVFIAHFVTIHDCSSTGFTIYPAPMGLRDRANV